MILPPKDFITTKEAARLSGYSADYIARLARSGVLKTKRVGRAWFVETVSLEEFARSQGTRKDERLRALAEERIAEYRSSQIVEIEKSYVVKDSASAQPAATIRGIRAITAARQAAYALIALLVVATGAFAAESPVADRVALVAAQTATGFRLLTQGAEQDIDAHLADATARTDDARDRITLGTDTIPAQDLALLPPRDILARATAPTFAPLALATTSTSIPNATFADLALLPLALAKGEASLTHALVTGETRAAYAYATVLPQAALGTTQGALALGAAVGRTAAALPALALSAAGQGARAALAAAAALAPRVPTLAPLQFAFALPAFPRLPSFALPSLASTRGFAAAALANLSLGERAALSTYLAIHGLIASTTSYLADVFTPTAPPIETPLPVEPPVALATTTAPAPAPVPVPAPTAAPAPALAYVPATYVTNNTYVTQGITQADLDQALSSLRLNLYGAIGNVGPAHEPDTIQHGVSITSQAGTFDTLTVGGATSVGTLTVGNTTIGSGTLATAYASTTVLTVAGPAYFGATATSTFAADGSLTLSHALGTASGGTGTTTWEVGSIPFANGTNLTEDNNNLFWDAADKRLGIGTNAPSETLTVGGVVRVGTADDAGLIDLGDTLTGSGNYTNGIFRGGLGTTAGGGYLNLGAWNGIAFNTSGTWLGSQATRMVIDGATGNVGIGTTSPGTALSVAGDGYLTGALGVGVATTTPGVLQTAGNAWIGGDLTVTGNSTVLGNSTVIGNSSTGDLVINSHIKSDIVPDQNDTYNLGSPSFYWGNAYVANLNVNNISAASTTIGGTSDNSFTINSNNATADAESAQLIFFRGTVVPNALLSWNAAGNAKRFEFNQPLYIQNASGSTTIPTLALASVAGQTANIVNVASSSGASLFSIGPDGSVNQGTTTVNGNLTVTGASTFGSAFNVNGLSTFTNASTSQLSVFNNAWFGATATSTFTSQGYLGIGSTSPWAALSVNPNGLAGPAFAVGSSTSTDLVVTNGGSVGIGTANPSTALEVVGDITSKGTAWTGRTAASNNLWNSVAYGNGTFVAVASSGSGNRVMTSPDGVTWTSRTSAANLSWLSVTYGAGEFVAVASYNGVTNNLVMTSPDGVNWTQRTAAAGLNWSSVTYGAGTFVAVANDGVTGSVMTSPDGVNWTLRSAASANDWDAVTYGNGTFVAVASSGSGNRVMTSPDGVTWTSRTSAADSTWDALTYGNGLFIAANSDGGTGGIMTSPDGSAWTLRTTPSGFGWQSVAYGNGTFVAVASYGSNTLAITSPDGVTWTSRATPTGNWSGVTYGAGTFVAVSSAGSGIEAMTSGKAETTPFAANNIYQGGMDIFGNVGIGTTTPNWAATFANPNGPQLALTGTGANEWTFREAGGNLYFATSTYSATSSASALTINPNGSLGIGTTSPATTLSVAGNGYFTGGLGIGVLNTTANTLNVNNAFLVNSSGSVGIGTTSPAQTLAVQGNGYVSGNLFVGGAITATSTLTITATTTALNFIASNLGAAAAPAYTFGGNLTTGFWSPGANLLAFSTGGLERLRIDGSGNLGLGTTSPFANLSIQNNYGSTNSTLFAIASSTSSTGSSANTFLTVSNSGLLNVGTNGANYFSVDAGTGSTTIANLSLGNLAFDTDAGIVNLSDIPVDAQVSAGTPESQSIAIGGLADLTAYGEADGLGGVQNLRVGIGSSTPSALLTLQNPYGNYNTNLFTISSSTAADGSAAASLLTFTNSGKLGIGTTTPNWPLTVANASGPQLAITGTGANEWTLREAGGNLYVATSTYSATSSATALTLASSGNVGIGTTSPSQTLSVVGGSYLNGAINAGGQLFFSANGASAPYGIEKNGSSQLQFNGGSGGYIFNNAANSANLVAILDSGNVGIGTTTPGAVLTVGLNTASGGDGLLIANQNSGGWNNLDFQANNGQHAYLSYGNSTNANANRFALQVGSNTALAVDSSGNMAFGGNIGNGSSLTSVSGAAVTILSSGLVGIGTTSPYSKLTIWGSDALTGTNAFLVSNNASSTLFAIDDGGNVNIASTTATTTIAGGLNVGNGGLLYNSSTGITSAAALQVGNLNFDADSGQVSWFDMPVTSASIAGTIESYTANLNSNPALTVYGLSDGAGGITNLGVGIGTTSPYATFAVQNQYGLTQPLLFAVASSTASNGSTANNFFTVTNAGNVGIGTTTPGSNLSVVTGLSVGANYGTAAPSNGLMVQGNALFGTTTSSGLSGHNIFAGGDGNGWITNATINGSAGVLEGIRSGVAALGTIGATTLALNPDGGNVGVGTTTPWAKLSVTGAGTGTGYTFIAANSSNTPLFTIQDNGEVGISTTSPQATLGMQGSIGVNNKQLYLAANGNVGVGGQSPGAIFAVTGSNNNNEGYTALFSSENGSGSGLGNQINITNTQSAWGLLMGFDGSGVSASTYHAPNAAYAINEQAGPLYLGTSNGVMQTITAAGNVGIGTTGPLSKLDVNGGEAIGTYAGTTAAPSNGLIVSGNVGIG
ncbi:hypothetical protein KGO04_02540, partial [Patescibacteria group bacterium]|nr:hypothetical protein [Patescibacteria group bacterium]